MSVLVDTSVRVQHFRERNAILVQLLTLDLALVHPMVILELACGTPPAPRSQSLGNMQFLRQAYQVTMNEALDLIERERLYGLGCGLVDVTLLASTLITPGARLWTLDRRLAKVAERFGIGYQPSMH
jgi:predicted nucleic acid-binding protein